MDFKSSNLHFHKDTDSQGQLNSQKNQTFSMCPFWNWEQIRAWEIWEKMVWIAQRWGSSFLPSASPVPKWCELRAGPSPDKDGKGFLGSGGALELFFGMSFPTGSISVREAQCARWILFSRAARGTAWKSSSDPKTCFFHHWITFLPLF